MSVNMKDFEVDGFVDWNAYRKAKVEAGNECKDCGAVILFPVTAKPQLCGDCRRIQARETYPTHNSRVRCPVCRHVDDAFGGAVNDPHPSDDGQSQVTCSACEHEYTVEIRVTRNFASPPLEAST